MLQVGTCRVPHTYFDLQLSWLWRTPLDFSMFSLVIVCLPCHYKMHLRRLLFLYPLRSILFLRLESRNLPFACL
ncbi:hypothetical protein BDZ91DRAFT_718571 [Kalaharituber pfeilii]|nr:hypothetical protein BDZ91DRAFT_718571 [Kalaharituber pfeilii]